MIHPHATALDRALAEQDAYVEAKLTGAPHEDALALAREDAFRRYEHRRVGYLDGSRAAAEHHHSGRAAGTQVVGLSPGLLHALTRAPESDPRPRRGSQHDPPGEDTDDRHQRSVPGRSRFSAVDGPRPQRLIEVLDAAKRLPGFAAAKAHLLDRLGPQRASSALDVGGGHGADVIELARRLRPVGRAIGVDVSENMIAEARRRIAGLGSAVSFPVADALALPVEDNKFDICRTETVLQHLADPGRAVSEMVRVTRPSGRVGGLEPEQETVFIDHTDAKNV